MSRKIVPDHLPGPALNFRKLQRRVPLCIFLIYRGAKELVALFEALHVRCVYPSAIASTSTPAISFTVSACFASGRARASQAVHLHTIVSFPGASVRFGPRIRPCSDRSEWQGPELDPLSEQTPYAPALLNLLKWVLQSPGFVDPVAAWTQDAGKQRPEEPGRNEGQIRQHRSVESLGLP